MTEFRRFNKLQGYSNLDTHEKLSGTEFFMGLDQSLTASTTLEIIT
jgi:hypothetical protein